jgi:hypothetical protein
MNCGDCGEAIRAEDAREPVGAQAHHAARLEIIRFQGV